MESRKPRRAERRAGPLGLPDHAIWGSELSPFALKLRALCDFAEIQYAWLPAEGSRLRSYRALMLITRAKRRRTAIRYPQLSDLDEYPLVPFLIEKGRRVLYDSSALAHWIDDCRTPERGRLFPEEPGLAFVARLIDEAFDEFGLYLVHHKRWVLSAASNDAGARLARGEPLQRESLRPRASLLRRRAAGEAVPIGGQDLPGSGVARALRCLGIPAGRRPSAGIEDPARPG
jgi:hypothetical protein